MPSLRSRLFYWMFRLSKGRSPILKHKLTLAEQRVWLEAQAEQYNRLPHTVELQPEQVGVCTAEWLHPAERNADSVVLFLHGGGFTMGSSRMTRSLAASIALASQTSVLSLNYRLAPEHPFPAALEDVAAAHEWLIERRTAPNRIAFVGESAGANLVLTGALALRDARKPLPAALVMMSPPTDLTLSSPEALMREREDPMLTQDWMRTHFAPYIGRHDPCSPLISPAYADLRGLPPMLIQVGEHEMLQDDAVRLAKRAAEAGVSVCLEVERGMWHGWQGFGNAFPESARSVQRIGAFIRAAEG